jgi:pyrimidine-nucleoside phosphorylase
MIRNALCGRLFCGCGSRFAVRADFVMNPSQIIARKRDGCHLTAQQVHSFIHGYTSGSIPDYQMSALAMAIYLQGMDSAETAALTEAMLNSGMRFAWPAGSPACVDKHSTGGVGDKVSLVLVPLLACCQLSVPMISGRGLGPTGGTLDKLESISGFRTDLTVSEIQSQTERLGCAISGASHEIAPADRKLYALRDVTATVGSVPLITASIMSKKLAASLDALVLDVKCGNGTFMNTPEAAMELARSLVDTGRRMGVPTLAVLTDMNQPLGRMVGNTVEVNEAVDTLRGDGPSDLRELVYVLGTELLVLSGAESDLESARLRLVKLLEGGQALERFEQMVQAQGGDLHAPRPVAPVTEIRALNAGWVTGMNTRALSEAVISVGGGRHVMTDVIDPTVGLELRVRVGDRVEAGQELARMFAHRGPQSDLAESEIAESIQIGQQPVDVPHLIVDRYGA